MAAQLSLLSDTELYRLFKKKDKKAFKTIFDRYWKRLYTYSYRIYQDNQVCEDIVQEVFISLWENRAEAEILNLEAYLFKSVKYKIANHIRDLKFTDVHEQALDKSLQTASVYKQLDYQELDNHLKALIDQLPPRRRTVFLLSREDHLSNDEIAERLGLSIRTVETHISHALKFLRSNIDLFHYTFLITMFLNR